jgi:4-hydroxy-3-methylbut-2-enyl diphosphate reductase
LVEVAKRSGVTARLVESPLAIAPEWLTSCRTVGLSAGASTPELLVSQALARLAELGFAEVETVATADESVRFPLPRPLRDQAAVAGRS